MTNKKMAKEINLDLKIRIKVLKYMCIFLFSLLYIAVIRSFF
ncbi:hypothetical protein RKD56_002246 [Priestia megaterium]|jgi:hypothetical protein|nr:hypothetical protein SRABI82_03360 [Priestia megaterium]